MSKNQKGGSVGFIQNLEAPRIGGRPEIVGYTSQPEYLDGKLVQQVNESGQLMGKGDMCGGGVENSHRVKRSKRRSRKRKSKAKKSKYMRRRYSKNRYQKRSRKNRNRRRRMKRGNQKGGKVGVEQNSVYHDKMGDRGFGCKQPHWDSKCL